MPYLKSSLLIAAIVICSRCPAQEPPDAPSEFTDSIREVVTKARAAYQGTLRGPTAQRRAELLAERSAELKDWLNGQSWEFTTEVLSVTRKGASIQLKAECPDELTKYSRNAGAFQAGGIFSHSFEVAIPDDAVDLFARGDSIVVSGTTLAAFGNDAPVRKDTDTNAVIMDIIIPPIDNGRPIRIEVVIDEILIKSANHQLQLAKQAIAGRAAAEPLTKPPIETALLVIEEKAESCIADAKRQKNTALVTETLDKYRGELVEALQGNDWTFEATVQDIVSTSGKYLMRASCHKSLTRFRESRAPEAGGIYAYDYQILIDRELAEQIGRGDVVTIAGKTVVTNTESFQREPSSNVGQLALFSVYLPPLDRRQPVGFTVLLQAPVISK